MTVKAKRGRRRYIYFESIGPSAETHETMLQAIVYAASKQGLRTVKLIHFDGRRGIVRCGLEETERLCGLINAPEKPFATRCTSGTVRTIRERYLPDQLRNRRRDVPPK